MKKLFLILLISIRLFAWEVNTHRAIDKTALTNVPNLNTFVSDSKIDGYHFQTLEMQFEGYGEITYRNDLPRKLVSFPELEIDSTSGCAAST